MDAVTVITVLVSLLIALINGGLILYNLRLKDALDKISKKDIEVWKEEKEFIFQLVEFLEDQLFNRVGDWNPGEKEEFFKVLNKYYAKLYLVADDSIIESINNHTKATLTASVRYYLYRDLRKQLMTTIGKKKASAPYIGGDILKVKVAASGSFRNAETKEEVEQEYPFIEFIEEDGQLKYKHLPFFQEDNDA